MTRRFIFDNFSKGTESIISVSVNESTNFAELCASLLEALAPLQLGAVYIDTGKRGTLTVLDANRRVQIGKLIPYL